MNEEKEADEYLEESCNFEITYDKNGNPKMVKREIKENELK